MRGPLSCSLFAPCPCLAKRPRPDRPSLRLLLPLLAGRAWLYLALNENSLESYLRLFQENLGLLHKYYVK